MSRAGSSSRKLPARTSSTSWHSAGKALWTDTARGRLLPVATATILVPLPRRVGPMARPPFWRSRRLHPRTPPPASTALVHANVEPATSKPLRGCRYGPTAGIYGGKSGTADTSAATPAIVPRAQNPKHAIQHGMCFVPRTAAIISTRLGLQHQRYHSPLVIIQFPASCHSSLRKSQSIPRIAQFRPSPIYETGSRVVD